MGRYASSVKQKGASYTPQPRPPLGPFPHLGAPQRTEGGRFPDFFAMADAASAISRRRADGDELRSGSETSRSSSNEALEDNVPQQVGRTQAAHHAIGRRERSRRSVDATPGRRGGGGECSFGLQCPRH